MFQRGKTGPAGIDGPKVRPSKPGRHLGRWLSRYSITKYLLPTSNINNNRAIQSF